MRVPSSFLTVSGVLTVFLGIAGLAASCAADESSKGARLKNGAIEIEFATPRLRIRSITFAKRPDLRLAAETALETPLYQFKLRGPNGRVEEIRSLDATSVVTRAAAAGEEPGRYVIEADHAGAIGKVSLHVALDESGFVDLRLEPGPSKPGWTISEVVFPSMDTRGLLSDNPEETLVGGETPHPLGPGAGFPRGRYPLSPRVPLLYQYGPRGGVYLMVLDPDLWVKTVGMTPRFAADGKTPDAITWSVGVELAAGDPPPRYAVRIGLIEESAYEAADVYRDWAERQPWCPPPLSERKDIASWRLRGGPHYFLYQAGNGPNAAEKAKRLRTIEELETEHATAFTLPEVPSVMATLPKQITELGGVVDLRGWEKWGLWMNPDWWPPSQGEPALRRAIEAIHQAGLHVTTDVQFNELSIHRPSEADGGFGEEGRRAIRARGFDVEDVATMNENGEVPWYGPAAYRSNHACPNVPAVFNDVAWTLSRMKDVGFDEAQFDGGGWLIEKPCWNPRHAHPRGPGFWQTATETDYYERMRNAIPGARESRFGFVEEYCNELRLHSYAAIYTRYAQDLPRDTRAFEKLADRRLSAPLPTMFSYIYHDRMIESGFFWTNRATTFQAAAAMALGVCAGPQTTPWLSFSKSLNDPWMRVFIAGTKARETFARKYLLLGRMLRPIEVEPTTTIVLDLRGPDGKWSRGELQAPAVLQQAYRAPDGGIGWVLMNCVDQRVECVPQGPLPPWFRELSSSKAMRRVTIDGPRPFQPGDLATLHAGAPRSGLAGARSSALRTQRSWNGPEKTAMRVLRRRTRRATSPAPPEAGLEETFEQPPHGPRPPRDGKPLLAVDADTVWD